MFRDPVREAPAGAVSLSSAIAGLREELFRAYWDGQRQALRFRPSPVELTLQVAATSAGGGNAGVRWWLIELGVELSRESVVTQTVKLSLDPVMFDAQGRPLPVLIDAADEDPAEPDAVGEGTAGEGRSGTSGSAGSARAGLDAPG